ncbi:M28 family peptidase [Stackebrandtia nassauensis]|uniref:Peptidase M28 n=1 Tax=Stackebrandtia nassauensis (strain DSM 44728 / CIP 108903 / NRRL B-16338 / NBRC 102104 / LLR-40K-21) TaxID=446470 RepID=D3PUV7_STANL|nr:M28 family peptidase [Stackebrandtia nassauensis]ADD44981.1 peptidase M28 [Stackebrandtia nassauensis DSM 44728]
MRGAFIPDGRRPLAAVAALLVLAVAVTVNLIVDASSPAPADPGRTEFSAERARDVLEDIATKPRPLGSEESDRVRDDLADKLRELDYDVDVTEDVGGEARDNEVVFGRVDNVVATLPGTDPTGRVLLVSHYDSVAAGPGAGDAGTPTAAVLETARALAAGPKPRNDIVVLLTDGEETGLLGADAYAREHPSKGNDVVLNWEARGTDGPSLMFETSTGNSRLIDVYADSAPHTTGDSSMVEVYRHMPNDTDFTNFSAAGYSGLNSANIGSPAWYHTPGDSLDHVDPATMQHHGANMLGLAAAFGDTDLATIQSDSDTVYFHFLGLFVSYTPTWGIVLSVLSLGLLVAAVAIARRRDLLSLPRFGIAVATIPVALAVSVALAQAMWIAMTLSRSGVADTRGMLHAPAPFVFATGLLAVAAVLAWYLTLRRRLGPAALALGALTWLALLGSVLAFVAPGAAFRLAIPALFAAAGIVGALLLAPRAPMWTAVAALAVGMVPVAVILVSTGSSLAEAFGLSMAGAPAVLFALAGTVSVPLLELWLPSPDRPRHRFGWAVPVGAAVVAVVVCATGLAVTGFDEEEPRPTYLAYVLNADTGKATWVTQDTDTSQWTSEFISTAGDPDRVPDGYREPKVPINNWGRAPDVDLPAPTATVTRVGDKLRVHMESKRGADNLTLRTVGAVTKVTAWVPDDKTVTKNLTVTESGPWGSSISFRDPPKGGVDVTLTFDGKVEPELMLYDRSDGLDDIPGYRDRPDDEMRSPIRSSDTVTVVTTVD